MTDRTDGITVEKRRLKEMELRELILFGVLVVLVMIFSFLAPNFFKIGNFMNLGMYSASMAITAAGMTYVIISGGMDISVGAIMSCCGILTANLLLSVENVAVAVFGGALLGIIIGFFNGTLVTKLRVNSIIVTIGTMSILRGAVYLISGGRMVSYKRIPAFDYFGPQRLGGIFPMALLIMLIVYLVLGFILSRLRFGRHIYATGSNPQSAMLSGIRVNYVTVTVFTISGLCAAVSGIVLTSLLGAGMPKVGIGREIDIIAATILGGASVRGGRGKLLGTIIGVLIIGVVGNALTQLGLITFWQDIFKGAILILAVYFDQIREARAVG
jgi:ribose/xylose/arabinose/galactoside ABC-type transport system permease subunit